MGLECDTVRGVMAECRGCARGRCGRTAFGRRWAFAARKLQHPFCRGLQIVHIGHQFTSVGHHRRCHKSHHFIACVEEVECFPPLYKSLIRCRCFVVHLLHTHLFHIDSYVIECAGGEYNGFHHFGQHIQSHTIGPRFRHIRDKSGHRLFVNDQGRITGV